MVLFDERLKNDAIPEMDWYNEEAELDVRDEVMPKIVWYSEEAELVVS